MAKLIGIIAGLVVFGFWMNIVGNPHVVETAIGLVIGIGVGFWVYKQLAKFGKKSA
jgi:hypothetical protein